MQIVSILNMLHKADNIIHTVMGTLRKPQFLVL